MVLTSARPRVSESQLAEGFDLAFDGITAFGGEGDACPVWLVGELDFRLVFQHPRAGEQLGHQLVPFDRPVEGHPVLVGIAAVVVDVRCDDVLLEFLQGVSFLDQPFPPAPGHVFSVFGGIFPGVGGHVLGMAGVIADTDGRTAGQRLDKRQDFLGDVRWFEIILHGDDQSQFFGDWHKLLQGLSSQGAQYCQGHMLARVMIGTDMHSVRLATELGVYLHGTDVVADHVRTALRHRGVQVVAHVAEAVHGDEFNAHLLGEVADELQARLVFDAVEGHQAIEHEGVDAPVQIFANYASPLLVLQRRPGVVIGQNAVFHDSLSLHHHEDLDAGAVPVRGQVAGEGPVWMAFGVGIVADAEVRAFVSCVEVVEGE